MLSSTNYVAVDQDDPMALEDTPSTSDSYVCYMTPTRAACFCWSTITWAVLLTLFLFYYTNMPGIIIGILLGINMGIPIVCVICLRDPVCMDEPAIQLKARNVQIRVVNPSMGEPELTDV
jgi:hypothetical protein